MAGKLFAKENFSKVNRLRWLGTFLTLGLFFYIIYRQDWQTISLSLSSVSLKIVFFVWVLFLFRIFINSYRWWVLLRVAKIGIPVSETIKIVFVGMFVSNFLPSTIGGDGIRFLSLLKYEENKSNALSSILIERFVNIIAMLLLLPLSLSVINVGSALTFRSLGIFYSLKGKTQNWKKKIVDWISEQRFWLHHPLEIFLSIFVSWCAVAVYFLGMWLIARDIGIDIKYFQVAGITVLTYLVSLLPISINGYGIREVVITSLYSFMGYSAGSAITLAIITRLLYLSTTLVGAIWLPGKVSDI